ncbi:ABC transporter permease [Bradyrhizobium cytisi]|uniref:ABC transporter permease n=1 Tax=Bradyrhizobium cytisi TaxID=515489 RepID=A0A5S4WML7_9BRAD|nr:ABC transporter permease [Bradyrhizobium cytisi]TYL83331.1 ABC transporter permease [Bradyrhizobium cytisi]
MSNWSLRAGSVLVTLSILLLWQLVTTTGLVQPIFLPSPSSTFANLLRGLTRGDLLALTISTMERMIHGWTLASLGGILLGALIGLSQRARYWLTPTLELLRPLPASTLLPVGIALFGLHPNMLLGIIAFGAIWPVLLPTIHGFSAIDPRLREVAKNLGIGPLAFALKFGLPNALPDVTAGMRLSLTACLIITVVGEMITAQQGLGSTIIMAARSFRSTDLYGGIVLLGAVGAANNALLGLVERALTPWRRARA